MASGGINFGSARPLLATVVENGVPPNDPRVTTRTDEAQRRILDQLVPVNGMMTVDIVASGTTILLPQEMESAYFVEVTGGASVNNSTDIKFGWYDIVNQFTYVDPSMAHDLPLVDQFDQPDPNDSTILRHQYDFPGLTPNATVRVTGPKRWLPIVDDTTYLIVQNIPAIKLMIQSIWSEESNDHEGAKVFSDRCFQTLQSEVKKYLLDPVNSIKRKADYESDMATYGVNTFGWTRARLAFELNGGMNMGKSELSRVLEQAEMRIMDKIQAVGTLQEYEAPVTGGLILAPKEVETIIAVSFNGCPIDIKSIFFKYHKHGHHFIHCAPELRDEGDVTYPDGSRRRQYRLYANKSDSKTIRFVAKLRWQKKQPGDQMIVKNFEAIRQMCNAIMLQRQEKWQEAGLNEQLALQEIDKQLSEYLSGQMLTAMVDFNLGGRSHGLL
jgi:hypothetical protein